jgi:3-phosphoshikimate 1-carboxyvinyltransferase
VRVHVPGDKSLTQRALILAALSDDESHLSGLLHGGDVESTSGALRALGVDIPPLPRDGSSIRIQGVGLQGLESPPNALDLGNSGTGTRLLLGVLAGSRITAMVTGDESLSSRPMGRVTEPLAGMGARFEPHADPGRLPLNVHGRHPLDPIDWQSPVASAQVKSSILLAGLTGRASAIVTEPRQSRDHTERMLRQVGVSVIGHATDGGWRVEMSDPPNRIGPLDFHVPGDVSSAAFLFALGALRGERDDPVVVEAVGLNPTRTAFLDVLERMGARVQVDHSDQGSPHEPSGDVTVRGGELRGTTVSGLEVPRMIDELPLVAVLGARAEGATRISDAAELRTKESDRIHALVTNLRGLGVEVEEYPDGLEVQGTERPLRGSVQTFHDHRIAMAFGILGSLSSCDIEIEDPDVADVSFPGFWPLIHGASATGAST